MVWIVEELVRSGEWGMAEQRVPEWEEGGTHTPLTMERVRNELIPKELDGAHGAKECAIA
jgi:hypothetical protein